jgi:hypothetical protein
MARDVTKEPLGSRFGMLWLASATSALGVGLATVATPLLPAPPACDH